MAEYIEKGATQAKIKELCDKYRIAYGSTPVSFGYSLSKITEDVPTADVQEVVRCKNCKWLNKTKMICTCPNNRVFNTCKTTYSNHYCSYGEKRSEQKLT